MNCRMCSDDPLQRLVANATCVWEWVFGANEVASDWEMMVTTDIMASDTLTDDLQLPRGSACRMTRTGTDFFDAEEAAMNVAKEIEDKRSQPTSVLNKEREELCRLQKSLVHPDISEDKKQRVTERIAELEGIIAAREHSEGFFTFWADVVENMKILLGFAAAEKGEKQAPAEEDDVLPERKRELEEWRKQILREGWRFEEAARPKSLLERIMEPSAWGYYLWGAAYADSIPSMPDAPVSCPRRTSVGAAEAPSPVAVEFDCIDLDV
mmetsp:Transcript_63648/g.141683  ORF Transcript_63648/g.141683 Transcript_63648/m.141683 type:complete len:267 (+) Transcript_63648:33-833(+)